MQHSSIPCCLSGKTDPYVILSLGDQIMRSKKNSRTTVIGRPGEPIWNQVILHLPRYMYLQTPFVLQKHFSWGNCVLWLWPGFSYACCKPQETKIEHPSERLSWIHRFNCWHWRGKLSYSKKLFFFCESTKLSFMFSSNGSLSWMVDRIEYRGFFY